MNGFIHSTESFGTVDGPGIRFVVFFQGCPMRCKYCHNPDTWEVGNKKKNVGKIRSSDSILEEYDSVKEFLKNGGITCTGGEPMLQMNFLTELFEKAKKKEIHTCLDTSGIVFTPEKPEKFVRLMKSTDLVMLDIKHIDPEKHIELTGQKNENILEFARFVSEMNVPLWIRHVVVPDITDDPVYLQQLGRFIAGLKTLKALDVLPYHTMGKAKYQQLGINYPLGDTPPMTKEGAVKARGEILKGIKEELRQRKNSR